VTGLALQKRQSHDRKDRGYMVIGRLMPKDAPAGE
jgi:hypothetical protein